MKGETEYSEEERRDLTDAFPSVFRIHGQHGNVASTKHLLMHVKLTYNGSDTLLLHHGLREMHTAKNTRSVVMSVHWGGH